MSDFKAKMHQIRFSLGICPRPNSEAYSASPRSLAVFNGPNSKGREWESRGGKEEAKVKVRGGEGRGEKVQDDLATQKFWHGTPMP